MEDSNIKPGPQTQAETAATSLAGKDVRTTSNLSKSLLFEPIIVCIFEVSLYNFRWWKANKLRQYQQGRPGTAAEPESPPNLACFY
jgi:hypothetical protein